ncbi:hypothetical protein [Thauera butanivorans]|uniref:hypothetical protein n=1 Tax=Thauera butanivorans TaxID=86174 RepID=UPI00083996AF|nr:hypothetical protein [Thauera butanivorans]
MASAPLAVVTIGYKTYLLSRAKATKLLELMSEAVECDWDFSGCVRNYVVGEAPNVELRFIEPSQVVMPDGVSSPAPASRRTAKAITRQPLRLANK